MRNHIRFVVVLLSLLTLVGASFAVSVNVSSPSANSTVASPVTIKASASSSYPITGWHIYVDGSDKYAAGTTQSISAAVAMAMGTHQIIVRAWDSTGAYGNYTLQVNVGSTSTGTTSSGVTVNVTSPAAVATVGSPTTIYANASSGSAISGWRIYVDGGSAYAAGATSSISAPISMGGGTHQVIVRAWNSAGAYGDRALTLTVGGSSSSTTASSPGGPTPPSNAIVYSRIEEMGGWGNCATAACSGSSAPASYWMAQHQTSPSLDGASTQYYVSGAQWADVLWYKSVGAASSATHFLLDYWIKPNADTLTHAEALEFDIVQVVNGHKWDISNECHYSGQHWDTWDGLNLKWIHTTVPCTKLDPSKWHNIKIMAERVGSQTHNISYTVDGVTYQVPSAYAWHQTQGTTWANSIIVQVQMDVNSNPGTVSEYIDKMTLYAW